MNKLFMLSSYQNVSLIMLVFDMVWYELNRKWGFEKLVYRDSITGIRRDRKYAVQPRSLYATGVHMSQDLSGKTTHKTEGRIMYFHYHGTISQRRESCQILVNTTQVTNDKIPYVLDTTLRDIAGAVKKFELKMIGSRLQKTQQWHTSNLSFLFSWWSFPKKIYDLTCVRIEKTTKFFFSISVLYIIFLIIWYMGIRFVAF